MSLCYVYVITKCSTCIFQDENRFLPLEYFLLFKIYFISSFDKDNNDDDDHDKVTYRFSQA